MYPYDGDLEILLPDIPGVVVFKSSLPPESLGDLLSRYHLSAVEYVTHIVSCVSLHGIGRAAERLVEEVIGSGACFGRVRIPRAGSLGMELLERAGEELRRYRREGCGVLSLEAFGALVCFGPTLSPHRLPRTGAPHLRSGNHSKSQ